MPAFRSKTPPDFRGDADAALSAPSDEAGLIGILARRHRRTAIAGDHRRRGHRRHRRPRSAAAAGCSRSRSFNRLEVRPGRAIAGAGVLLRGPARRRRARPASSIRPIRPKTARSIGGTIATNASGSRSFRYGDTRRHVLRLRVVLMDGRVLDVAPRRAGRLRAPGAARCPHTTKNTAGYRAAARHGLDRSVRRLGRHAGRGHRSRAAAAARARGSCWPASSSFPTTTRARRRRALARGIQSRACSSTSTARRSTCCGRAFPEIPAAARAAILFEQELSRRRPRSRSLARPPRRRRRAGRGLLVRHHAPPIASASAASATPCPKLVNDTVRRNGFMKMGSDYAVPLARNREMLAYLPPASRTRSFPAAT